MNQELRTIIAEAFRLQAKVCAKADAPTVAAILFGCGDEVLIPGGVLDPVLADWTDASPDAALPLRVLGGLHRLVLDGGARPLAEVFPSAGGRSDPAAAWPRARDIIAAKPAFIRSYLDRPPQTNEVGRSAMLLGGFLEIAARDRLPLRILELGASAGLNLHWDSYRVATPAFTWGPEDAPLTLTCDWEGPAPVLPDRISVAARAACDRDPLDIRLPNDRRRLESYVWTDQLTRLDRLRRAIAIAAAHATPIERADAESWLARVLESPTEGVTTVVYHSVFWSYLPKDMQARMRTTIVDAGRRARPTAPLAWLAMELPDMRSLPQLTLTQWPGGEARVLATVHFHGAFVRWTG